MVVYCLSLKTLILMQIKLINCYCYYYCYCYYMYYSRQVVHIHVSQSPYSIIWYSLLRTSAEFI